jgi:DNA repair exonuclease SbcCD ATPase subunit
MTLRNYRGIAHRDIELPDSGVVVISGANEIGKSSMIEALDLLLAAKDRSSKREVKQVKPTHADEGSEVTAEISTGPYRFVYFKRFNKSPSTVLTVLAPRREQLTGDEAHDRVLAILDETMDTELWRAQRVLQSSSTAAVDLSGCDALSRALDVAAGQAVALSGAESPLIDRIDGEYRLYFTQTGRPTGEWAAATNRLKHAMEEVAQCEAAIAEVDDATTRHARLTDELARAALERSTAAKRKEAAQAAADAVERMTKRLKEVRVIADAAASTRSAAVSALAERRRLRADLDDRTARIAELQESARLAADEQVSARDAADAADGALALARSVVTSAQARVDAARAAVEQIAGRDEAARLTARLARIDAAGRELTEIERELAGITLSDKAMRGIEVAATAVERAAAKAELASATIELVAVDDVELMVGGQAVVLAAGGTWSTNVGGPTEVELPGVLTVRMTPGAPAADTHAVLEAAKDHLAAALDAVGVADLAAANELNARRRELSASRDRLTATRDALVGDDTVGTIRDRLAELLEAAAPDCHGDAAAAKAELVAAKAAHRHALAECEARGTEAASAVAISTAKTTRVTVLGEKLASARTELSTVTERLARQRQSQTDDDLVIHAEAEEERCIGAAQQVAAAEAELAATEPAAVAAELEAAVRDAERVMRRHDVIAEQLGEVTMRLKVYGSEGRKGRLDAAEIERAHAEAEYARTQRCASAAALLRSVMTRHRDDARLRYVDPFRTEVQRLGRIVFGADFEVEIDAELRICSRTLDGRTVPYDSLSGGAKEQLGIVARLAGAALVAKEDGVPVVIDDALGFSDADRLAKMAGVFDAVGGDGQVIVLTCSPDRYAGVRHALHVELTA